MILNILFFFFISANTGWFGIKKNETVNLGSNPISTADAEKYLIYDDGTHYVDIGGPTIKLNDNNLCIKYNADGHWHDVSCTAIDTYKVICEFNCDNLNDN